MKLHRVTAILLSAILTASSGLPMTGMRVLAAEEAGVQDAQEVLEEQGLLYEEEQAASISDETVSWDTFDGEENASEETAAGSGEEPYENGTVSLEQDVPEDNAAEGQYVPEENVPEDIPSEETASDENRSEEILSDENLSYENLSDENSSEDVSPDETLLDENPSEGNPSEVNPSEASLSEENRAEETAPGENSSEETASEDTASEDTASEDTALEDTASEDTASEDTASEDTASEDTASEDTASEEYASGENNFEEVSPEEDLSEEAEAAVEESPEADLEMDLEMEQSEEPDRGIMESEEEEPAEEEIVFEVPSAALEDASGSAAEIYAGDEIGVTLNDPDAQEADILLDTLTVDDTEAYSTTYVSWTARNDGDHDGIQSDAVYAGSSAKGNGGIQMRSKNSHSGIVTTGSGGIARRIKVQWVDTYGNENRYLQVYGSNTAYESAADLYNADTCGTDLGVLSFEDADLSYDEDSDSNIYISELAIEGRWKYIGIRSKTGALYLESVQIGWESDEIVPVWSWAEDFSSATAAFTDGEGNETVVNAEITQEISKEATYAAEGERTYTAVVTYQGAAFIDRQTEVIPVVDYSGPVTYVDGNGDLQDAPADTVILTGTETSLQSGWYAVVSDISYDHDVELDGDINLILCDGMTLEQKQGGFVDAGEDYSDSYLTIFGQENNSGKLFRNPGDEKEECVIDDVESFTMYGGIIDCGLKDQSVIDAYTIVVNGGRIRIGRIHGEDSVGINGGEAEINCHLYGENHVTINGGKTDIGKNASDVSIETSAFGFCGGNLHAAGAIVTNADPDVITLSWTDSADSIYAKMYRDSDFWLGPDAAGKAVILQKDCVDDKGNQYPAGTYENGEFDGRTLYPDTNPWSELQTKIDTAESGDTITLDQSYKASDTDTALVIPADKALTIDLNGYTIDRGLSNRDAAAGGNVITANGDLTVRDTSRSQKGKITGGNNTENGGGIILAAGYTFVLESGSLTGNKTEGNGGGVWGDGWVIVADDGSITGNTAGGNGGAICFNKNTSSNKLKLSGSPVITGNTGSGGAENNVYLSGSQIMIYPKDSSSSLNADARIGISVPENSERYINDSSFRNKCALENFTSDSERYLLTLTASGDVRIQKSYVFHFAPNGGTGEMDDIIVYEPTVTLPECTFTAPEGKRFKAWSDGFTSNEYPADEELSIAPGVYDFTITPIWADVYTITVYAGENPHGTVKANKTEAIQGETVRLTVTTEEHYALDAVSVTYGEGQNVTVNSLNRFYMPAGDVTVTAAWKELPAATIKGVTGTFNDKIRLNYYFEMADALYADENACVTITNESTEETVSLPIREAEYVTGRGYKFSIPLAAKEAGDTVTAKVFDGQGSPVTIRGSLRDRDYTETGVQYSLMQYFTWMESEGTDDEKAVGAAAKDYCSSAQIYFDYNADGVAVSSAVDAVTAETLSSYLAGRTGTLPAGVSIRGISAMLESDNTLRLYLSFRNVDPSDFTYAIDGSSVEIQRRPDGAYYLALDAGVFSNHLQDTHTYSVSDGTVTYSITASVLTYARSCAIKSNEKESNIGKALYLYNRAAVRAFGSGQ